MRLAILFFCSFCSVTFVQQTLRRSLRPYAHGARAMTQRSRRWVTTTSTESASQKATLPPHTGTAYRRPTATPPRLTAWASSTKNIGSPERKPTTLPLLVAGSVNRQSQDTSQHLRPSVIVISVGS